MVNHDSSVRVVSSKQNVMPHLPQYGQLDSASNDNLTKLNKHYNYNIEKI